MTARKLALAVMAGSAMALAGCAQNLFYQPNSVLYDSPINAGLRFEQVQFQSQDGTLLTGWFIPAVGLADPKQAKATVIQFHGNAQNISSHWRFGEWLPRHGYNLFVFDYRGYGASQGSPNVKGVFEDSNAALNYIRQRSDVDPDRLVVFGQSLGGTNAIAAVGSGNRQGVRAVIIESTFSSYSRIASDKVTGTGILMNDDYSAERYIGKISPIPLVLIHGTDDKVIPLSHSEQLLKLAGEPKQLIVVPGGEHIQAFFTPKFGTRYQEQMLKFLDATLQP